MASRIVPLNAQFRGFSMTTDAAEATAVPEVQATLPGTPEPEAVNDTPPAPPADDEAPEPEGEDTESEPEAEPEVPKGPRTVEDIEAAYDAGEPLTRAEIDQLAQVHNERAQNQERIRLQGEFLQNAFPNAIQGILNQDLADLGLDQQTREILQYRLSQRLVNGPQALAGYARQVFEQPLVQLAASELMSSLIESGMKPAEAHKKVYSSDFYFRDYIKAAFEAGQKKASLSKDDVTYDWFKKNRPDEYKKFHKDFPERGGGIKPADSRSSGGTLTPERYQAMSFDERQALRREHPEQIDAMVARASGR